MPLTEQAILNDKSSGLPLIPMHLIFADSEFNCRGTFTATDIIELVKDTSVRGLIEPVILRELWDTELDALRRGFKYSLVAGFRRYSAYKANVAEFIPGTIRQLKSDFDCRDINAVENLQRTDLTLWQEAKSIRHYWVAGWSREDTASRVSKSPGWVQIRYMLLSFEPEIQQAADQGYILSADIRELYKYHGAERLRMAGQVRDARKKGETRNVTDRIKKADRPEVRKKRGGIDIIEMMDVLRTVFKELDRDQMIMVGDIITPNGNSLVQRLMAWINGEVTTLDVHMDLKSFCKAAGYDYKIPSFRED